MNKARIVVSVDLEGGWGHIGSSNWDSYSSAFDGYRHVALRLIQLCSRHQFTMTWAIVGFMYASSQLRNRLWVHLPESYRVEAPAIARLIDPSRVVSHALDAPKLVERILRSDVRHEIASHTFSHVLMDQVPQEEAELEVALAVEAAAEWGIRCTSFVFPQNRIAHLDVIRRAGFNIFRGRNRVRNHRYPPSVQRAVSAFSLLCGHGGIPVKAELHDDLIELKGSLLFRLRPTGWERFIDRDLLVMNIIRAIDKAVQEKSIFHMWLHPYELVYRQDHQLQAFERVLSYASRLRSQDQLEICTMQQVASETGIPHNGL